MNAKGYPGVELVESEHAAFRGKTVFIIRHAQGQHNVSPHFEFDPPLTAAGLKQVKRQTKISFMLDVGLVLVSPLRRTLQTATGLFPEHPNMVALEDLREQVHESCNLRQDTETLRSWFPQVNMDQIEPGSDKYLNRFSEPSSLSSDPTMIDCLDEETDSEIAERCHQVLLLLASRPESRIAMVSHGMFLHAFLNVMRPSYGGKMDDRHEHGDLYADFLDNCEIRQIMGRSSAAALENPSSGVSEEEADAQGR